MDTRVIITIVIVLGVGVAGYFIRDKVKTVDREIKNYQYQVDQAEEDVKKVEAYAMSVIDSVRTELDKEIAGMDRYKDSIEYDELKTVRCYDNSDHKHSCVDFK